jgi:acyl-coenzyme A thioesterase PaaI-like protein
VPDRSALPTPAPLPEGDDGPLRTHTATCFGCGPDNAAGLHLGFVRDGDVVRSTTVLRPEHHGINGIAHGGIVATVLDDVSGSIPPVLRQRAVTARLDVAFHAPVLVGRELVTEAWLESFEGRKIRIVTRLTDEGRVLATGRALFITVPPEHFERRAGDGPVPMVAP